MKPIRLSAHAMGYLVSRGFTASEVEETIRTEPWKTADLGRGRMECTREYVIESEWNGTWYKHKQVRPIFVEEDVEIVVITVYTYYY